MSEPNDRANANVKAISYSNFIKDGSWKLWCVVGDISEGNKETAKRCADLH